MKRDRSIFNFLFSFFILLVLSSCSKRVSLDWSEVGTFSTPHNLELSSSTVKFRNGQGGTQKLTIQGNIPWEITGLPDWLTADTLKGSGEATVLLTCAANPSSTDERSARFAVCAAEDDWDYSIPVAVYQVRALGLAYPDTSEVMFNREAGMQTIPVACNVEDWTVSVAPMKKGAPTDWLSAVKTDDGKAVEISVVPNEEVRREAYVVLKTSDSEKKITVVQKSSLDVSPMIVNFPYYGETTKKISVEAEGPFEISGVPDWLKVDNVSERGFSLTASPNMSVERTAIIKISMTGQLSAPVSRSLTVHQQDPYMGHDFVDLALPSGLLWATCNVGANSPDDYGYYFAWGETSPKENYSWRTYEFWAGGDTLNLKIKFSRYNFSDSYVLRPEDDAAQENWGGIWRMPTSSEMGELGANCNWTWTKLGEHYGYKVTSKKNGKSIFLPAAGFRRYVTSLIYDEVCLYYWVSKLITTVKYEAHCLMHDYINTFGTHTVYGAGSESMYRHCGLSVRPVCPGN